MHDECGGAGPVIAMPSAGMLSRKLKVYLERAGITRADLFAADATRKAITFYDASRATGITWAAVRGDGPLRIMQRAGHSTFQTTVGYIREAENLSAGFGVPFGPLPASLLGAAEVSASVPAFGFVASTATAENKRCGVGATGFERAVPRRRNATNGAERRRTERDLAA
jgi:hypothetical protein